jgi:hypothetical protein
LKKLVDKTTRYSRQKMFNHNYEYVYRTYYQRLLESIRARTGDTEQRKFRDSGKWYEYASEGALNLARDEQI